ncbi:hypothetical protein SAMN05660413_01548 [Salegentibacter flavus]|uniref:Uncharacterized protein n=1 Tax=Salegentibacter flavus TaxID=287099 RepID=A0A1I4ZY02_9FLAO|nr:hypothetical protein SAMN05660413_01548 [Salegentibacter flavus]
MLTPLDDLFGSMLTPLAIFFLVLVYLMNPIKKITNGWKTKTNESSKTNTSPAPAGKR